MDPRYFIAFVPVIVVLNLYLFFSRNGRFKKVLFPTLIVASGAIMAFVAAKMQVPWPFLLLIAFISAINLRCTRFCEACGAACIQRSWWLPPLEECVRCGQKLTTE